MGYFIVVSSFLLSLTFFRLVKVCQYDCVSIHKPAYLSNLKTKDLPEKIATDKRSSLFRLDDSDDEKKSFL